MSQPIIQFFRMILLAYLKRIIKILQWSVAGLKSQVPKFDKIIICCYNLTSIFTRQHISHEREVGFESRNDWLNLRNRCSRKHNPVRNSNISRQDPPKPHKLDALDHYRTCAIAHIPQFRRRGKCVAGCVRLRECPSYHHPSD